MAKINTFIASYTDTLQELDIPAGEGLPPKAVIRRFLRIFKKIDDAYDASNEICLYSEAIDEKTNEIPVAQKTLKNMNLKGCIVTFDALHTQKDTVAVIREQKGDIQQLQPDQ